MSKRSVRRGGTRGTKSAPSLSRHSKSKSKSKSNSRSNSLSRSKAIKVSTKGDLRRLEEDTKNVNKVFIYNGIRIKLTKEAKYHYEQFQGPTQISAAVWVVGGDLKIQLL